MPESCEAGFIAIAEAMKRSAKGQVEATKPFGYLEGEVSSESPLKIRVDQKLELVEEQLILTNAVRDHYVFLEAYDNEKDSDQQGDGHHVTEKQNQNHIHKLVNVPVSTSGGTGTANGATETQSSEGDHDHDYKGGVFKVKLGLKKGEKVHLLQVDGGQHFIVLDRKDPPKGKEGSD